MGAGGRLGSELMYRALQAGQPRVRCKELLGGLGIKGWREKISLRKPAAERMQTIELSGAFDALSNDIAGEFGREGESQVDHVVCGAVRLHLGHESAIDLEDVGREAAQRRERDRARAEVVEGGGDFKTPELREDGNCAIGISHGSGLRDCELKEVGRKRRIAQTGLQPVEQLRTGEVAGTEIDSHVEGWAERAPKRKLQTSLANYPLIDKSHEAAVFGGVEEGAGRDESLFRVLPPDEGFETNDLARVDLENRLESNPELTVIEGRAKIGFEFQAANGAILHRGIEKFGASSTHGLGTAQGGFDVAQQIIGSGLPRRAERDANAERAARLTLPENQRSGGRGLDTLGDAEHIAGIRTSFEQNRELVSADAREDQIAGRSFAGAGEHLGFAETGLQPSRDFDKRLITGRGAESVIEILEAINVGEQKSVAERGIALCLRVTTLETVEEQAAVGQTGERVVQGIVCQLFFGFDARCY